MNKYACTVIERLGGPNKVAEICQIKPPSVYEWRHNGIPKARDMYLRLLKPDVFHGLRTPK